MTDYLHHIPGRLRVRSKVFCRDSQTRREALRQLSRMQGVASVRLNHKAGSVTIVYDVEDIQVDDIIDHLKSYQCWASQQIRTPQPVEAGENGNIVAMIGKVALNMLVNKGVSYSLSSLLGTRI